LWKEKRKKGIHMFLLFLTGCISFGGCVMFPSHSIYLRNYPCIHIYYEKGKNVSVIYGVELSFKRTYPYWSPEFQNKELYFEERYLRPFIGVSTYLFKFYSFVLIGLHLIQISIPEPDENFIVKEITKSSIMHDFSFGFGYSYSVADKVFLKFFGILSIIRAKVNSQKEIMLDGIGSGISIEMKL